ncbi:MAG TPA: CerR family C-terminal domain-containing protein [Caulobacter sp.]|nr:CerR family C-terminal domain-containing protein [Caulobacter sp.]
MSSPQAAAKEIAGGYRKGEAARQRILDAALAAFGEGGFKGATTRQIAEAAGVNLPALKYYFGGKEGLYLACAEEIVERYRGRMLGPIEAALAPLEAEPTPAAARTALKRIMTALADQMMGVREADAWAGFVLREIAEPGPAFPVLYGNVWAPGVELIAQLIGRATSGGDPEAARIEALLLISSLTAFGLARPVALRFLAWPDADGSRFDAVMRTIEAQIDRLA